MKLIHKNLYRPPPKHCQPRKHRLGGVFSPAHLSMYSSQVGQIGNHFPVNPKNLSWSLDHGGDFQITENLNDAMAQSRHAVLWKDLQHQPLCQDRGLRMCTVMLR